MICLISQEKGKEKVTVYNFILFYFLTTGM